MENPVADGRAAAALARLGRPSELRRIEHGESNDVWFAGDIVIRMATAPGHSELQAEAELVSVLPPEVGYPAVVGTGVEDGHEWMATERIGGANLGHAWPDLPAAERLRAFEDLYGRLEHVHRTDIHRVDPGRSTPFYALNPAVANRQLQTLPDVFDDSTVRNLHRILDAAFPAIAAVPRALMHTDAGPGNAVWNGRNAIPVDFEFACIAPADLEIENLARKRHGEPEILRRLAEMARPLLIADGAYQRILGYTVLREIWAVGKWIENWPQRRGIESWQPVCALREHAAGTSWVAHLFSGR
ncbi:MAG TPA: aminoglycoside phosphotransferase family protein [Mycobacteriales bacterium]|nr:aminoglycoside phosphotransferase family protein [Mycobacteriales bacterium]